MARIAEDIESGLSSGDDPLEIALTAMTMAEREVQSLARESLNDSERLLLDAKDAWLRGDGPSAISCLDDCIEYCRRPDYRDPSMEARARMERGIIRASLGDAAADSDLRWAMDRLSTLAPESSLHGLSILNLAGWHESQGERMMAMATLASIGRTSGHDSSIIGLSRQRSAAMRMEMNDHSSASRLHWVAWRILARGGQSVLAEVSALRFIDLALQNLDSEAERMDEIIELAVPTSKSGGTYHGINPKDVAVVLDWITPKIIADVSGKQRPDLVLFIEASNALGRDLKSEFQNQEFIEDPEAVELIQS